MTVFLSFGDGRFEQALQRIEREAVSSGYFERVTIKRPADLGGAFWRRHGTFVRSSKRGFGYWIWKPHLILQQLLEADPDEIVVYADAGCSINRNGRPRFEEYCRLVKESPSGVLGFQLSLEEKRFTKGDAFQALDAWHLKDTPQVGAGVTIWRQCERSIELATRWNQICGSYQLISDAPSIVPDDPAFVGHRHDQSLLSLVSKLQGATLIDDETYREDWNAASDFPFLATRKKGRRSRLFREFRRDFEIWRCRFASWGSG